MPAVDIRGGRCVQLVGGDPRQEKITIPDPVWQAHEWQRRGAEWLHVVDLDRALGHGTNVDKVERLVQGVNIPVQVGGGVRERADVERLLDAGAARVVVGTRAVKDRDWLREQAATFGDAIVVALDAKYGEIVVKGWTEGSGSALLEFARDVDDLGLGGLLCTDVSREGRLSGVNVSMFRELAEAVETPVIASGGIASVDDLVALKDVGAWGAVVGMAFYTGKIDFEQALREVARG